MYIIYKQSGAQGIIHNMSLSRQSIIGLTEFPYVYDLEQLQVKLSFVLCPLWQTSLSSVSKHIMTAGDPTGLQIHWLRLLVTLRNQIVTGNEYLFCFLARNKAATGAKV